MIRIFLLEFLCLPSESPCFRPKNKDLCQSNQTKRNQILSHHGRAGTPGVSFLQQSLNWWFGILGLPLSNNPFHKGMILKSKPPGPKPPISSIYRIGEKKTCAKKRFPGLSMENLHLAFHDGFRLQYLESLTDGFQLVNGLLDISSLKLSPWNLTAKGRRSLKHAKGLSFRELIVLVLGIRFVLPTHILRTKNAMNKTTYRPPHGWELHPTSCSKTCLGSGMNPTIGPGVVNPQGLYSIHPWKLWNLNMSIRKKKNIICKQPGVCVCLCSMSRKSVCFHDFYGNGCQKQKLSSRERTRGSTMSGLRHDKSSP